MELTATHTPTGRKCKIMQRQIGRMFCNFGNDPNPFVWVDSKELVIDQPPLIPIGTLVRSYDFPGNRTCYVEGIVEGYCEMMRGCSRYAIRVMAQYFNNVREEDCDLVGELVYPPMDGIPTTRGTMTVGVEVV